jgi:hypothetical protein
MHKKKKKIEDSTLKNHETLGCSIVHKSNGKNLDANALAFSETKMKPMT